MTKYRISTKALPEGVTLAKKPARVAVSTRETYPFTQLQLGESFYVPGKTARDLRGPISHRVDLGMRFVSRTERKGATYGARVYRTK